MSSFAVPGTLQAGQTVTAGERLTTAGTVQATQTITGGSFTTAGTVQATQTITTIGNIQAAQHVGQNIQASGAITGGSFVTAGTVQATQTITTSGNIQAAQHVGQNVQAVSNIYCSDVIIALSNVTTTNVLAYSNVSAQYVQATTGLKSAGTVQASGAIVAGTTSGAQQFQATNSLQSSGTVQASGAITAGTIVGGQQFQATNNVQSSNIATQSIVVYGAISALQYQGVPAGVTQVGGLGGGTISSAVTVQGAFNATTTVSAGTTVSGQSGQFTQVSATQYQGISSVTQVNNLGGGTITSAVIVQGSVSATGDLIAYYQVSDDRLKNRVGNIQEALEKVNRINGFTFTYNEEARTHGFDDRMHVGVSAQELEQVLPEVVRPFSFDNSESKFKRVEYEKIIPLLVESIKELTTRVEQLEDLTKSLKTE